MCAGCKARPTPVIPPDPADQFKSRREKFEVISDCISETRTLKTYLGRGDSPPISPSTNFSFATLLSGFHPVVGEASPPKRELPPPSQTDAEQTMKSVSV